MVPAISLRDVQSWHRGCGNGMIIGNVGMVVLSVLASVRPTAAWKARDLNKKSPSSKAGPTHTHTHIYI